VTRAGLAGDTLGAGPATLRGAREGYFPMFRVGARAALAEGMLLVDGNGLVAASRPWHSDSWDWQRRIVIDVARLTHQWDACADVVFEGYPRSAMGPFESGVRAWFARRWPARAVLLRLVRELAPGEGIVATSDPELARQARFRGARVVPSEALRRALDRVGAALHARQAPPSLLVDGPEGLLSEAFATSRASGIAAARSGVGLAR